jgi:DnaK suppressor protein
MLLVGCLWRKGKTALAFEMKQPALSVEKVKQEEEMTTDFNLLRRRLETERESLLEELKTTASLVAERRERDPYGEQGELATEIVEVEKGLILETRVRDQLAEVEHALHKFDQGTYGLCDICGQPIEPARLEALPQANLCLSCKALQAKNRM